uniref:Uncharacterized protein n=1 Tax=Macaca fascicularis TaxID=9541 RepID=A0A7N9CVW3_MACFA
MTVSLYSSLDDRARPCTKKKKKRKRRGDRGKPGAPHLRRAHRIQKSQDAGLDGPSASRAPRLTVARRCCWPAHGDCPASGAVSGPKNGSVSRNWYVNWQHFVY